MAVAAAALAPEPELEAAAPAVALPEVDYREELRAALEETADELAADEGACTRPA